jgi:hypothetical protein
MGLGIDRESDGACGAQPDAAGLGCFGGSADLNLVEVILNFSRSLQKWVRVMQGCPLGGLWCAGQGMAEVWGSVGGCG